MQIANSPLKWTIPFANGDSGRVEVPATTADPTKASLTLGFPPLTREPPETGGVPPHGEDFNGAMNQVARIAWWQMGGGRFNYDAAFATDTNVNGYPQGGVLASSDQSGAWVSLTDNNTANPDTVGTGWAPLSTYGVTALTGQTGGTTTLTPVQAMKRTITIAGTLTSNLTVVLPAWTYNWQIANLTTGAFTVTVKTAAGSGTIIPQTGTPTPVAGDGTNISSADYLRNDLASTATGYGAALVGFKQAGTAAAIRTALSKLRERVTPEDFGAVGDGVTDDLPAFNAAVTYLKSLSAGGVLYIPAKSYYLSGALNITSAEITLLGEDRHNSRLIFGASAADGISYTFPSPGTSADFFPVVVSRMTLLTNNTTIAGALGNPAVAAISVTPTSISQGTSFAQAIISDVEIRGNNGYSQFWNTGIYLNNVNNCIVSDCCILGHFNYQDTFAGVYSDNYSINCSVIGTQIQYCTYGALQYSNIGTIDPGAIVPGAEGFQLIGCQIVGVKYGATKDNGTNSAPRPLLLVTGTHINATQTCINVSNCTESVISGNLFYIQDMTNVATVAGAQCVRLAAPVANNPNRHVISGSIMRNLSAQTQVRGVTSSVGVMSTTGCVLVNFDYGFILSSTSNYNTIAGCEFSGITQFDVQNAGTNNTYAARTAMTASSSFNI